MSSAALPGVPTFDESGLPGYQADLWYGIYAPRATPGSVIASLNGEVGKILGTADVKARFTAIGIDPVSGSAAAFEAFTRAEIEKWGKLIREAGITASP